MSRKEYIKPGLEKQYFTCPRCGGNANMDIKLICNSAGYHVYNYMDEQNSDTIWLSVCPLCKKTTFWVADFKTLSSGDKHFINQRIIYPDFSFILPMPTFMPDEAREYWDKSSKFYHKDARVSMMYLRLCLEKILRNYFNEPNTSLANLINRIKDDNALKNHPWTHYLVETKDFLNNAHHSTNSIDFEREPLSDDLDLVFELIVSCVHDLYESRKKIDEFKRKQFERTQKITKDKT